MRHKSLLLPLLAGCLIAASIASLAAVSAPAPAASTTTAPKAITPDPHQALVDEAVAGLLQRYHYSKRPLDAAMSQEIFKHYLEDLDPNRSYFLQADVDGFANDKLTLGDDIRDGDLQPAFDIYNLFQTQIGRAHV